MAPSHAVALVRASAKRWQGEVWAGLLSREMTLIWGADVVDMGGRPCPQRRFREPLRDPARSENLGTHGIFMRENREVPWSSVGVDAVLLRRSGAGVWRRAGREGNAEAVIP